MTKTIGALCAGGALAIAGTANAATLIETEPFAGVPDFVQTLTFDQWNPGPGEVLTSIQVIVDLNVIGGDAAVDNDGALAGTADVEFGASGGISSTDVSLLDLSLQPIGANLNAGLMQSFNLTADNGDGPGVQVDAPGNDYGALIGGAVNDGDSGFVNSIAWGAYTGAGTFDILVDINTLFSVSGLSGVAGSFNPVSADGSVTVIYNYIPAPGAAGLLALGGLAAARRRR